MKYEIDESVKRLRRKVEEQAFYYDIEKGTITASSDWQGILYLVDKGIAAMLAEKIAEDKNK